MAMNSPRKGHVLTRIARMAFPYCFRQKMRDTITIWLGGNVFKHLTHLSIFAFFASFVCVNDKPYLENQLTQAQKMNRFLTSRDL